MFTQPMHCIAMSVSPNPNLLHDQCNSKHTEDQNMLWLINSRNYSSTLKTPHTKNLTGKYKSPTKWQHPPHLRTCLSMLDKAPTSYWLFFWGFLPSPGVATSAARQLGTFCQKHPKHNDNRAKHKCWPIWKKTQKPKHIYKILQVTIQDMNLTHGLILKMVAASGNLLLSN